MPRAQDKTDRRDLAPMQADRESADANQTALRERVEREALEHSGGQLGEPVRWDEV